MSPFSPVGSPGPHWPGPYRTEWTPVLNCICSGYYRIRNGSALFFCPLPTNTPTHPIAVPVSWHIPNQCDEVSLPLPSHVCPPTPPLTSRYFPSAPSPPVPTIPIQVPIPVSQSHINYLGMEYSAAPSYQGKYVIVGGCCA